MKASDVVSKMELDMEESQNQRDARVEKLWKRLDTQGTGELDWKGLQKGLRKIDHPLKNADDLLKVIIRVVDTNGDGKIQYEEFRVFVEATERQLYFLFKAIDSDHNGRLDKEELQLAFQTAGLAVPARRFAEFFEDIDVNKDGYISFGEWRDFLLFMPHQEAHATLRAVFTFYSDIVTLTSEGDSVVSDEKRQGLESHDAGQTTRGTSQRVEVSPQAKDQESSHMLASSSSISPPKDSAESTTAQNTTTVATPSVGTAGDGGSGSKDQGRQKKKFRLTKYIPDSGYFLAGAIAGGVSRTATAPLDRLKVYLLVDTKSTNTAVNAAKQGQPVQALKQGGRTLGMAIVDLYKAGGIRGFFAGNGLNVVKIMPETAIRFGAYEAAKRALANVEGHNNTQQLTSVSKFVAGGTAGMVAQFCVYPLDTLKFRLQSEYVSNGLRGNALLIQTFKTMWKEGGVHAAYRGVTMGLVGMFPYSAIDMSTFEFLKTTFIAYKARQLKCHEEDYELSSLATGIMGASSGAFGATVVYPLNVLRTRLQTQGTKMHPQRYTGIWDVAQKTIKNEGVRGLYKGLMPNLLKVAPALSITWMVYEKSKKLLNLK